WLDSVVFTALLLPALLAAGLRPDDPRVRKGGDWLLSRRVRDLAGLHFDAFGMEVWVTTFQLRALLASGVAATDPDVVRGLEWLVGAQSFSPVPVANNRKPNGLRSGGWALESTNHNMIDCDDTGVVLSTFGMALRGLAADHPCRARVQSSADRARAWLLDMQNPDGGWSAYVWDLPGKPPGPVLETTPRVRLDDPIALIPLALRPPASMSDPSTEDVTARVLHGLAELGATIHDPAIARAVDFLRVQQCASGAWWGRWGVNYIWGTTFVLWALAAVGADLNADWVRRGIRWLRSVQNADGGWGELPESYRSESRAGIGPSMPALTGLAVCALVECGECDSPAVLRGVRYLLDEQRPDGAWLNRAYLHTNVPPDTFYVLPAAAQFYPLEALGRFQAHHAPDAPKHAEAKWNDAYLDQMRQVGDAEADQVVRAVYEAGSLDAVNALLGAIFRSDDLVPHALPQAVRSYLERDALPSWADPAQISLAHALFERAGWQIAAGLFCSSLPQAYAAASGAHVIAQTQALTRHVKQRIFETAQFLFDTMDHGGLERTGRGVRSAQKVRLMHAGVRYLLSARETPAWDRHELGVPINQEDLAGTLLTFSLVTLDALDRLGVEVTRSEANAWLHTWKAIGHVLGIREDMLPVDLADARALMDAIRGRQWASSKDGKQLIVPLIEMMQSYFPGRILDGMPIALVRHLAGDHCADLLGLPKTDCVLLLVEGVQVYDALRDVLGFDDRLDALFAYATHTLMKGVVTVEREGKQARFRIPKSLLNSLGANR
ncbi:MAG TPA: oxygenase MpaB family protein, partial [Polyangiales bacterium]|nr:oxygenase MpaB family protein [Polyangiales bacterium]